MAKFVSVNFDLEQAWETWILQVPDEADENWVLDNLDKAVWWEKDDSGYKAMMPTSMDMDP